MGPNQKDFQLESHFIANDNQSKNWLTFSFVNSRLYLILGNVIRNLLSLWNGLSLQQSLFKYYKVNRFCGRQMLLVLLAQQKNITNSQKSIKNDKTPPWIAKMLWELLWNAWTDQDFYSYSLSIKYKNHHQLDQEHFYTPKYIEGWLLRTSF